MPMLLLFFAYTAFPMIAFGIRNIIPVKVMITYFKYSVLFFLLHNIFYFFGYTLKGDDFDYAIFAWEYMTFAQLVLMVGRIKKNTFTMCVRILGAAIVVMVCVFTPIILLFERFEDVKGDFFTFISNGETYEMRGAFNKGFVTTMGTSFTFNTYRTFKYLPIEKLVDHTVMTGDQAMIKISDTQLFQIRKTYRGDTLILNRPDGAALLNKIH